MSSTSSAILFWRRNVIAYECCFGLLIVFGGHQLIPFDANGIYTVTEVMSSIETRSEAERSEATMFKPELAGCKNRNRHFMIQ